MSNTLSANVIRVDTSANFTNATNIVAIKYIGAANGTAVVESNGTDSDLKLWEESGTSNAFNQVYIRDNKGVRVEVTNSAVVYLYLK
jgi:hypothetical protein